MTDKTGHRTWQSHSVKSVADTGVEPRSSTAWSFNIILSFSYKNHMEIVLLIFGLKNLIPYLFKPGTKIRLEIA